LDGATFDLLFRWNGRDETWYLSIFSPQSAQNTDGSRVPIVGGIPVLVGWPLLSLCQRLDAPAGDFVAIDTSGQDEDPGQRDLGDRVVLLYYTADELANG
jgi:hypothetical protein